MSDITPQLQQQVEQACQFKTPLVISGGNSKHFLGRQIEGEPLGLQDHAGVINYEPTELVITARCGTRLNEINALLAEHNQMLAFEPPAYGDTATLGGTIACNLSGPRRAYAGAARDYVLGCKIINGKGEVLSFGGEVMKNVAGYDVSRLMCGAYGTLGVLLEVSLKVVPQPVCELTIAQDVSYQRLMTKLGNWSLYDLPISATAYDGNTLYVRLCGSESAVQASVKSLGGDVYNKSKEFWQKLREQQLNFFNSSHTLWRVSVPGDAPLLDADGKWFIEWHGGLRWHLSDMPASKIRDYANKHGGHATVYRGQNHNDVFQPLAQGIMTLHRHLKQAFDPENILNPGKLYAEI